MLGHLQVPPEQKGPQSESFRVTVNVAKNQLRSNVLAMSNALQKSVREAVALEIALVNGVYLSNEEIPLIRS